MTMHLSESRLAIVLGLSALTMLNACSKEDADPPATQPTPPAPVATTLAVTHNIDALPLTYDTIRYFNEVGNHYSVTRLEYYLSGLVLKGADATADHALAGPWYINGTWPNTFSLGTVPAGVYSGIEIDLGLPPALNQTNALPNTMENVNMAWPIPMGGGYHFMKFEGHFMHQGQPTGFAMHLGKNQNLVHCVINQAFVVTDDQGSLTLQFNLNEVFSNPYMYDLATGNQSMGSDSLMAVLRDNCTTAFLFEYQP